MSNSSLTICVASWAVRKVDFQVPQLLIELEASLNCPTNETTTTATSNLRIIAQKSEFSTSKRQLMKKVYRFIVPRNSRHIARNEDKFIMLIIITRLATTLRACPREDQAGVAHAISPIFLKLGLVKGFTQKLHRPKPFDLWILPSEYRPPPFVFQGKPLKTHQNMAVKLEALLLLLFSRFYFYLAWALVDSLLVHSESFASCGLILVNQCQSIVDHVMT